MATGQDKSRLTTKRTSTVVKIINSSVTFPSITNLQNMSKKIILCLHGWRTNSQVMRSQCQDLFEHAGSNFIVHYLDAPHDAKGPAFEAVELAFESAKKHGWKEWSVITYIFFFCCSSGVLCSDLISFPPSISQLSTGTTTSRHQMREEAIRTMV